MTHKIKESRLHSLIPRGLSEDELERRCGHCGVVRRGAVLAALRVEQPKIFRWEVHRTLVQAREIDRAAVMLGVASRSLRRWIDEDPSLLTGVALIDKVKGRHPTVPPRSVVGEVQDSVDVPKSVRGE